MTMNAVANPRVVSQAEWLAARKELLAKEKNFTRQRDALSAQRREMPWVKVDKEYVLTRAAAKKRCPTCLAIAVSSSYTTSCSVRSGNRAAQVALWFPITSTARLSTSRSET